MVYLGQSLNVAIYAKYLLRFQVRRINKYICCFHISQNKYICCFPSLRLKEAEDARTLCVSIEGLECSGQLRDALLQHASAMTDLFRQISKLTSENCNEEGVYQPLFDQATAYSTWYKSRKKVANSMKSAAAQ